MHQPATDPRVVLVSGPQTAAYGFGGGHPFGPDRHDAFLRTARDSGVLERVSQLAPRNATQEELTLFHTAEYVEFVERRCAEGVGSLDAGDTPAERGIFEAACWIVGATLRAVEEALERGVRGFVPIGGLHHAAREAAAGFCVFNDCAVAAAYLLERRGLERVAYVDIDVHHGDGVYYGFVDEPRVLFADIHEDGRYLYPGTGSRDETGRGAAQGTKLNCPLPPGSGDEEFLEAWQEVEAFLDAARPQFILLQCGADGLAGDPLAHLKLSARAHRHAAERLCALAARHADGRLVAMGGGGYDRPNLGDAWTAVLRALADTPRDPAAGPAV